MLAALPAEQWEGGKVHFIRENVIHLMRGQMYRIQGKDFFVFGGARSHDIEDGIMEREGPKLKEKVRALERRGVRYRINHLSWWKEEMPDEGQDREGLAVMEEHGWRCDYVVSHCAPSSVQAVFSLGRFEPDELTGYLEGIKNRCRYRRWFCGHYHMDEMVDERHTVMYRKVMRIE